MLWYAAKTICFPQTEILLYFRFSWLATLETLVTEHSTPPSQAPDAGAKRSTRRSTTIARRQRAFDLMVSGHTLSQVAKMVGTSVATVRREINQALAERRLEPPKGFAQAQIARLIKALRLAEAAIELGELKAAAAYLRIAAAIDRYHELAAGSPPPVRSTKARPPALPTPPKALTFVEEAERAGQPPER
jgi:AraC-like DNA-binding protein